MAGAPQEAGPDGLDDARRARLLRDSGLLGAEGDPNLTRLTQLATRLLGAPVSLVSLVHAQGQDFPGQTGLAPPWAAGTPLSHSFCRHVVSTGEPLVVPDSRADPRTADNPAVDDLRVAAYAGHPVTAADGTVLGSFCVISDVPRRWSGDELRIVADLAQAVSAELRLRLLAAAERRAREHVTLLSDVTLALHSTLDVQGSMEALAAAVVPALADCCAVDLVVPGQRRQRRVVVAHRDPATAEALRAEERRAPRTANPRSALQRVLAGESAVLVPVVDPADVGRVAADEEQERLWRRLAPTSLLVVPVCARGEVSGALSLLRCEGSPPFEEADLELALELGRRAGVAIDNDRLYAAEHEASVALQLGLLPTLPDLPGVASAARYRPGRRGAQVGGDWYDLLALPDGAVGVVIGDVVGHDSAAAATMGQLRAVLRSYAWDHDDPAEVLDRTCRLVRGMGRDQLATVFYGLLSPPRADGGRTLHHSTAGHPPPVLLLPDGSTRLLDGLTGTLIGLDLGGRPSARAEIAAGSTLVCYTDGLVERRADGLAAGTARLREVLTAHAGAPLDDLADAVLAASAGEHERDDTAVLAVRV